LADVSTPDDGDNAGEADPFVEKEDPEAGDSFDLHTELTEAFGEPKLAYEGGEYTQATGELPKPLDDGDVADAHAPPFLRENQCCIADRSAFVTRSERGVITRTFKPEEVTLDPDGTYRVLDADGHIVAEVEPLRRECEHFVRQLTPPTPTERLTGVKKGWVRRYCAARRSTAGAFLEMTDSHMGACSMRKPFDAATAQILDDFDDTLEGRSRNREYVDMFASVSQQFLTPPKPADAEQEPS
jgi:hypothetical protein